MATNKIKAQYSNFTFTNRGKLWLMMKVLNYMYKSNRRSFHHIPTETGFILLMLQNPSNEEYEKVVEPFYIAAMPFHKKENK